MIPQGIKDTMGVLLIAALVAVAFHALQKKLSPKPEPKTPELTMANDSLFPCKGELLIVDSVTEGEIHVRQATKEDAKAYLKSLKNGELK